MSEKGWNTIISRPTRDQDDHDGKKEAYSHFNVTQAAKLKGQGEVSDSCWRVWYNAEDKDYKFRLRTREQAPYSIAKVRSMKEERDNTSRTIHGGIKKDLS